MLEYFREEGRKGGLAGGVIRAENLTAEQRQEIARKAAATRWKNHVAKRPASSRKKKSP